MKKLLKKLLAPTIREVIREEEKHRKVTDWKEIEKNYARRCKKRFKNTPQQSKSMKKSPAVVNGVTKKCYGSHPTGELINR